MLDALDRSLARADPGTDRQLGKPGTRRAQLVQVGCTFLFGANLRRRLAR